MTSPPSSSAPLDRGVLLVAGVVILGAIMSILDVTVVNVALNTLAAEFDTTLTTVQWVATGYTLALATVIPLTGWAADRFGTKRLYMTSIVLFVGGSLLSALAWSAGSLIAFRVLQGLGGGMLMPAGMTILTRTAGPQRVGRVMGIIGIPMLLGPILGPIIGGWLVDDFSWRWIFLINLPIGITALVLARRVLPADVPQPAHRLDWLGLAMLSPGLAAIIYGLAESSSNGGFGHAEVLVPALLGALAVAAFFVHAVRTPETALIDPRLFRNRTYSASMVTQLLVAVSLFGSMLLMPLYFQTVRGESAMATGLLLAPQGLGAMLTMPIAGRLTDRTGTGRIVPVGLILVMAAMAWLTQIEADSSYLHISANLFLLGLGMGATMMPTFSGAIQTLRRSAIARATTTLNINQQVGASLGTAILSVLLAHELVSRLGGGGGGRIGVVPDDVRVRIAPQMAEAFGATFVVALVLVSIAFVVAAVLLPKRKPAPPVEDEAVPAEAEAEAAALAIA
jgi:EmrB/QacA subfamily drug resistance transporter